jgi:N-acetylglutamate synthase-like GNAT family acetyltransferase
MEATVKIRHSLRPGDPGLIIHLHGVLYAQECGYDRTFEAYVAEGIAEFVRLFDPDRDYIWLAEAKGRFVGCVAVVHRSGKVAQLRWLLVHPDNRGQGIGTRLLKDALRFCRARKYRTVFLWTTSELAGAAHLYARFGFRKTERKTHRMWGRKLTEERYDLLLRKK